MAKRKVITKNGFTYVFGEGQYVDDGDNADWPKAFSWDFPTLPETEEELTAYVRDVLGKDPDEFRKLVAYQGWKYTLAKKQALEEQQTRSKRGKASDTPR